MKLAYGSSRKGDVPEALRNIKEPAALFFSVASEDMLERTANEIEEMFPGVPSIGGVGQAYIDKEVFDSGITVIAMKESIKVVADVLEEASVMPIKYIRRLENAVKAVGGERGKTACFDICSAGVDVRAVTTLSNFLCPLGYDLAGGTSNSSAVACNGRVYKDACAFFIFKNLRGKIKSYKENIYIHPKENAKQFMVTEAEPKDYRIRTLENKSAEKVYTSELGISRDKITTQTFKNPFGHVCGSDTYIVSIKGVESDGSITTFRPANKMDFLTILSMGDYREVVQDTISKIKSDLGSASAVLSVNCLFRYIMFNDDHYWDSYLAEMCSSFTHAGMVGVGEHYNTQFVNQTMCCLAFE
ncbi:MAG: hypothetical protein K2J99_14855 [Lachnospiraceae bacterium]|nr:hypothetical protein [Lachnospiraceae bacterium]